MSEDTMFHYQVVQPDGNISTGFGTRSEINTLKKVFQVRVEGEDANFQPEPKHGSDFTKPITTGSAAESAAKTVLNLLNSKSVQQAASRIMSGNNMEQLASNEQVEIEQVEKTNHINLLEDNPLSKEKVVENAKYALTVVTTGSKDLIWSTAKNAWEAALHAATAAAGMLVIAITGKVVKETAVRLPGALNNVTHIITNVLENTQKQVKLLTANALEAVNEAQDHAAHAAESAESAAESAEVAVEAAKEVVETVKDVKVDGVGELIDEESE
jgi:hypothetical protein